MLVCPQVVRGSAAVIGLAGSHAVSAEPGMQIVVSGDTPPSRYSGRKHRAPRKSALDSELAVARLKVTCYDRTTGAPLCNVTIQASGQQHRPATGKQYHISTAGVVLPVTGQLLEVDGETP
jgi:hypothetical protein